jgi:hypothetical protein
MRHPTNLSPRAMNVFADSSQQSDKNCTSLFVAHLLRIFGETGSPGRLETTFNMA